MTTHDKIYTVLLMLLAFFAVAMAVTVHVFMIPTGMGKDSHVNALRVAIAMYCLIFAFILITLVFRFKNPRVGALLSKATNVIIMYPFFPIGVIIGIYGFWKVDKKSKEAVASNKELKATGEPAP